MDPTPRLQGGTPPPNQRMTSPPSSSKGDVGEDIDLTPTKARSQWKGKGKMREEGPAVPERRRSRPPVKRESDDDDEEDRPTLRRLEDISSPADYPPQNIEEVEERQVIENMKRWEQAERQRRKEARESRTVETASATTLIGDVARRASLILWSNDEKAKRRSRRRTKDYALSSSGVDVEERTSIASLNRPGVETPTSKASVETERNSTQPNSIHAQTHQPSHSQSSDVSQSSTATVTKATNPFDSTPEVHIIITPQEQSLMKETTEDPFASGPPSSDESEITSPKTPTARSLRALAPSKSDRPVLQVRQSTLRDANGAALKPPTPRPFDLPPPRTPPPPLDSDDEAEELEMERQRHVEARGGLEQDSGRLSPVERKRWWTDWLCGCFEGHDRGGEQQAASTNPME